jgi:hypothetical protein
MGHADRDCPAAPHLAICSYIATAVLLIAATPALAINRCEEPGKPPTYQDAPCPVGTATGKQIESDSERAARFKKEEAQRKA